MNFEKHFYGDREVVVFIDESGDPSLRDPGNPLFLFGACLVTGAELQTRLRDPWFDVREKILGSRESPLHMREIGHRLTGKQLDCIKDFFVGNSFKRISFAVTDQTLFEGDMPKSPILALSLEFLLRSVADLTFGDMYVDGMCIVFEDGPLVKQIKKHWPARRLQRKDGAGVISAVPVSWAVLPKSANEPALEVADFIAHTAAGHTRASSKEKFEERFQWVFPPDRPNLIKSLILNKAEFVPGPLQTDIPS